jgi:hypothetical protein
MRLLIPILAVAALSAEPPTWPQFRGPAFNPTVENARLAEKWSKTENIEWLADIPGRGWSSPIVAGDRVFLTTVVTDGASKKPQTGTEYSNELAAELMKQGLSEAQIMQKIN